MTARRAAAVVVVTVCVAVASGVAHGRSQWERGTDMPTPRGEVASAVLAGRLMILGGFERPATTSDEVSIYDIASDNWTEGVPLPAPRHHAAAATLGDWVYAAGGSGGANFAPTSDVWRIRSGGQWEEVAPLPQPRAGHAMVALGGKLYIVGGQGESETVLIFDPATQRWSHGAALEGGNDHIRAVSWRGRVWAIGGRDGRPTARVATYDPRLDRWQDGPGLPEPMSAMAVGVVAGILHVAGGEDPNPIDGGVHDAHYTLRAGTPEWTRAPAPPVAVHGGGYGVVRGRFVIAGGATMQGLWSVASWSAVTQTLTPDS